MRLIEEEPCAKGVTKRVIGNVSTFKQDVVLVDVTATSADFNLIFPRGGYHRGD